MNLDSVTSETAVLQKQSLEESAENVVRILMKTAGKKFSSFWGLEKYLFYSVDVSGCFCLET